MINESVFTVCNIALIPNFELCEWMKNVACNSGFKFFVFLEAIASIIRG